MLHERPFQGLFGIQSAGDGQLAGSVLVTLLLIALTRTVGAPVGRAAILGRSPGATAVPLAAAFTVRTAWTFAYITYDYSTELMTFAHGTPDVTPDDGRDRDISRRTVGDS